MFEVIKMKWKFSCYGCGMTYQIQHRQLQKSVFNTPEKKGRPTLACTECNAKVVGDMVGGRS